MAEIQDTAKEDASAVAAKQNASLYLTEIPLSLAPARRLLEQYSGIAPEDVDAHIIKIASSNQPRPCYWPVVQQWASDHS